MTIGPVVNALTSPMMNPTEEGAGMAKRIVILGGGTGGTLMANRLRKHHGDDLEITVVDQDDRHV